MIKVFIPTFHCSGRCAEVIELYQKAFDLKIDWQDKDIETGFIKHTEARIGDQRLRLSDGGTVIQFPHKPAFATCMSELKDKFGFKWFLMVD